MSRESRFAALVIAGLAFVGTTPALAVTVTEFVVVNPMWNYGPNVGRVDFPKPTIVGTSWPGLQKILSVSGIRVYDLSINSAYLNTIAVADVQFWWRNGMGPWVKYGPNRRVESLMPNYSMINNSVVLPSVIVPVTYSGYNYTATVTISWWMPAFYNGVQAYKRHQFYSPTDYLAVGNAQAGSNWVLIR